MGTLSDAFDVIANETNRLAAENRRLEAEIERLRDHILSVTSDCHPEEGGLPLCCEFIRKRDKSHEALQLIANMTGCECDSYNDHTCMMCRVREVARRGLEVKG